jgi:hypothetical protein
MQHIHLHQYVTLVSVSVNNTRADIQNVDIAILALDVKSFKLKTEAVDSAETVIFSYETKWFHNQERIIYTPEEFLERAQSCMYPCVRT